MQSAVLQTMLQAQVRPPCLSTRFLPNSDTSFVELREFHAMFPPQYDALRPALMLRYHVMVTTPSNSIPSSTAYFYSYANHICAGLYFHKRDVDKLLQYLATLNHDAGALEAAQMKCEKTVKDDEEASQLG